MLIKVEEALGLDEDIMKKFRSSSVNLYNKVPHPQKGDDRERAARYRLYWKLFGENISKRSDELINALTDMVKDFPSVEEIKAADKLLNDILCSDNKKLLQNISAMEKMLSVSEKNSVIMAQLKEMKKSANDVLSQLIEVDWAKKAADEAENMYTLSQILSMTISIIDSLNEEFSRNQNVDLGSRVGVVLYLALRTNAYFLRKITKESLLYTISAVQVYAYRNSIFLHTTYT